jgi:3-oxoacyl-[acyl-carrier-protein] synthase II
MSKTSVVITGVGAVTSLGSDFATIAANLLAGKSAAAVMTDSQAGVEVRLPVCASPEAPVPSGYDENRFRSLSRSDQFVLSSSLAALSDAGYGQDQGDFRIGMVLGCGGEWLCRWESEWAAGGHEVYEGRTDTPTLVESAHERLGLRGPKATVAAACASGNYALAQARRWIQLGLADICLAGAVEAITPICRSAFNSLRALSKRINEPQRASRPFDQDRDGFVMGEGAAVMVLESAANARRRGARVYAEIAGFGASSDAFHMIIPSGEPAPAAAAMRAALADAQIEPHQVDYVNAHATSTPVGDKAEARAIKSVFGPHTTSVPVSSTKSMTGHLLSAAAAVEALACLAAIDRQTIPPTINLDTPDPECDLCHVPRQARLHPVTIAMSNSFGFGGSNTTLILRKAG